ncbi:hypothetical protein Ahy_B06g082445 [Arachis hypogaea]|uniref:Uncharacterized protein n=1 Tax=Arachis hypogaea TaxID=3818 RepID=A0A444YNF3_ARAHY|nr:hypothetical protein Ahy_B06g082445 [Arachis hypogaea]
MTYQWCKNVATMRESVGWPPGREAEDVYMGGQTSYKTLLVDCSSNFACCRHRQSLFQQPFELQNKMVVKSEDGRELRSFTFKQEDQRPMKMLRLDLHTCFWPLNAMIESNPDGKTLLELVYGSKLLAKILINCDEIQSPIAKWMGFAKANYVEEQPYEPRVNYIYGRGVRAGYVPISLTNVYWFICFNSSSPVGVEYVANVDSQVTCDIPCGDDGQSLIGGREAMIVDTAVENANCVVEETPEIMLEREGNRGAQER